MGKRGNFQHFCYYIPSKTINFALPLLILFIFNDFKQKFKKK